MRDLLKILLLSLASVFLTAGGWYYIGSSGEQDWTDLGTLTFMFDPTTNVAGKMTLVGTRISDMFDQANSYDLAESTDNRRAEWIDNARNGNGAIGCEGDRASVISRAATGLVKTDQPHTIFLAYKQNDYESVPARGAMFTIGMIGAADSIFGVHQSGNTFIGGSTGSFAYGTKGSGDEGDDSNWHTLVRSYDGSGPTDASSYHQIVDGVEVTVTSAYVTGWNSGESTLALCSYTASTDNQNSFTGLLGRVGMYNSDLYPSGNSMLAAQKLNTEWAVSP